MQLEKCKRKSSQKVRLFATSNINLRLLNRTPLPWIKQFGAMPGNVGLVSDPETQTTAPSQGNKPLTCRLGGGGESTLTGQLAPSFGRYSQQRGKM